MTGPPAARPLTEPPPSATPALREGGVLYVFLWIGAMGWTGRLE